MKITLLTALLLAYGALSTAASQTQTVNPATQTGAPPEAVVRDFYAWYLGELNKDNWSPLKNRSNALKYLTPEYHRRIPRIIEEQMVDIIICAQDWDKKWAENYTVGRPTVRGNSATLVVRLPAGGGLAIKIKTTLVKRNGEWKINGSDCVN